RIMIQNNVGVGFPYFIDGTKRGFITGSVSGEKTVSGNLAWNVARCPDGVACTDPMLADMTLAGFDPEPQDGSPVIGAAEAIACTGPDFRKRPRPSAGAADIGAIQARRP
ncbi:choice-of-anchor Q domain-containing protein, partial [Luteimonas pelagia]